MLFEGADPVTDLKWPLQRMVLGGTLRQQTRIRRTLVLGLVLITGTAIEQVPSVGPLVIMQVYAPTSTSSDEGIDKFYDDLDVAHKPGYGVRYG